MEYTFNDINIPFGTANNTNDSDTTTFFTGLSVAEQRQIIDVNNTGDIKKELYGYTDYRNI